jgi:hypothetical protein
MSAIANAGIHPILIDAGPSPNSTHWISTFMHCAQLYAWKRHAGAGFPVSEALIRGTIIHTGYAHIYARIRQAQCKLSIDAYYPPLEAAGMVAASIAGESRAHKALVAGIHGICEGVIASHETATTFFKERVLYIEDPFEILVPPPGMAEYAGRCARCGSTKAPHVYDATVRMCADCGVVLYYLYTRKPDVVWMDAAGVVWIIDHKTMQRVAQRSIRRYAPTVGFIAYNYIGHRVWGKRYGGVIINAVEMETGETVRVVSEPAPEMLRRFQTLVHDAESYRLRLEAEKRDPRDWPRQANEYVCFTPYGPCDALALCLGTATQADVAMDINDVDFELEGGFADKLVQLGAPK